MILTVRSKRATERKFQAAKWPENERARERVGQGANWPDSYWPIRSGKRIGPGAKRLATLTDLHRIGVHGQYRTYKANLYGIGNRSVIYQLF